MDWLWLDWAAVAALGGLVGASELISRYKDDPMARAPGVVRDSLYRHQQCRVRGRARPDPRQRFLPRPAALRSPPQDSTRKLVDLALDLGGLPDVASR
jgi:hypothetical protein